MEKHFGKVGMVRENLLAKPQCDPLRPDSVKPAVRKDLHLNLDRMSAYAPGSDQDSPLSGSSQHAQANHGTVPQTPVIPSPASGTAGLETPRLALQPVYAAIAVIALFNLAFIGWVLFELSDLSKLAGSTQQADPTSVVLKRLSAHDSSIDTLQFAVSAIRSELVSLDSRIKHSGNDAMAALAVDTAEAKDGIEAVDSSGDYQTAVEKSPTIEIKKNIKEIEPLVAAVAKERDVTGSGPALDSSSVVKKSVQLGAVNNRLAPKKNSDTPAQELVHKSNEKPFAKKIWLVNLGTFSSEGAAESMRKNVSALGYNVRIVRTKADKKPVLKVQLGDFTSWKSAQSIVDQLEMKTGITGLWVSRLN